MKPGLLECLVEVVKEPGSLILLGVSLYLNPTYPEHSSGFVSVTGTHPYERGLCILHPHQQNLPLGLLQLHQPIKLIPMVKVMSTLLGSFYAGRPKALL